MSQESAYGQYRPVAADRLPAAEEQTLTASGRQAPRLRGVRVSASNPMNRADDRPPWKTSHMKLPDPLEPV